MNKFYTPQEIADLLAMNYRTILKLIYAGKLKAVKINRQYRIKQKDFDQFMK